MNGVNKLTSERVESIFLECLFQDGEPRDNYVVGEGIHGPFGFHPKRLESFREDIGALLDQLPEDFQAHGKAGGTSFLKACVDREDRQWGEHRNMEQLFALGTATGQATCLLPREVWHILPGSMPYFCVDSQHRKAEEPTPAPKETVRDEEEI